MAAEIQEELGVQAELIRGGGGIFDVTIDGKLVYSKHATGRFPDEHEVVNLISKQTKK